jgi:esterase/lipase
MQPELSAFQAPEHRPFHWPGDERAALLIHGFPGTPAEMRQVAQLLHEDRWTVDGLLLPGFGSDFAALPTRRHADWVAAIDAAVARLRRQHRQVVLVGNSMGAALALRVAAQRPVDGLILFVPFWRVDSWLDKVYPLAQWLMPQMKPFRRVDFADPRVREGILQFMPDTNLDDPAVQSALRELRLPVRMLGQVRLSGQLGYHAAHAVDAPVLIIQGRDDPLVKPHMTRQLAARLPKLAGLVEVQGGHELIRGDTPDWPLVATSIRDFTGRLVLPPHGAPLNPSNPHLSS